MLCDKVNCLCHRNLRDELESPLSAYLQVRIYPHQLSILRHQTALFADNGLRGRIVIGQTVAILTLRDLSVGLRSHIAVSALPVNA